MVRHLVLRGKMTVRWLYLKIRVEEVKTYGSGIDNLKPLLGKRFYSGSGIYLQVADGYRHPDETVWYALHQCYTSGFSMDDPLPKDPGEAIVKKLLKKSHFGPLEHVSLTVNIGGVSRVLMAQLTRHRTGITFDVQSLRYTKIESIDVDESAFTVPPYLRKGAEPKARERYVGSRIIEDPEVAREKMLEAYRRDLQEYLELLEAGIPAEDARMVLPLGLKINMVMSANVRTFFHLMDMRLPPNAQWEIRELCELFLHIGELWMPKSYRWYRENRAYKHKLAP